MGSSFDIDTQVFDPKNWPNGSKPIIFKKFDLLEFRPKNVFAFWYRTHKYSTQKLAKLEESRCFSQNSSNWKFDQKMASSFVIQNPNVRYKNCLNWKKVDLFLEIRPIGNSSYWKFDQKMGSSFEIDYFSKIRPLRISTKEHQMRIDSQMSK